MITQRVRQLSRRFSRDQRGITGLETAIVLVAFVLVASVFAYAVLNTGLFASDKSKASVNAGLKQTTSTLEQRGAVIAEADASNNSVKTLHVVLASAPGGDPISLAPSDLAITYSDNTQVVNLNLANAGALTTNWLVGGDPSNSPSNAPANKMMAPGDEVELVVDLSAGGVSNPPGNNTNFTLEIKPKVGSVITINRTTPSAIDKVMNLN